MKDYNKKTATETLAIGLIGFGGQQLAVAFGQLPTVPIDTLLTATLAIAFGVGLRLAYEAMESKQHRDIVDEILGHYDTEDATEAVKQVADETETTLDELGGTSENDNG